MGHFNKLQIAASALVLVSGASRAGDLSGNIGLEGRYFLNSPVHEGQERNSYSISLQPEYRKSWDNYRKKFAFTPFYRWDSKDDKRTHFDIRELDVVMANDDWEYQAGVSKVFWGVTESQHLVDIINQTDLVEGVDGEEKLGQPMLRVSRLLENGSVSVYILPYFRERTFPGKKGRLRTAMPVDTDNVIYESNDRDHHLDFALRWSQSIGNVDFGVYWFEGTSRDPEFVPALKDGEPVLRPYYPLIRQAGLDAQYTGDAWLWKLESIYRTSNDDNYNASVGGFEYTIPGIADTTTDLGLLAEVHYDSRGKDAPTAFQKDLFVGTRLAMNDVQSTELLAGVFIDLEDQARSYRVEASRRLGDNMKLNLEAQLINNVNENEPFYAIRQDDYIQIEFQRFF